MEVIIADSTSFQVPASLAHLFAGSGGTASDAAIKIRFGYDLKSGRFFYHIQAGNTPDNTNGNGMVEEVSAGSLRITDLGFFNIQAFGDLQEKGAYYLSRMKGGVNLYQLHEDGTFAPLDLVASVTQMTVERLELDVALKGPAGFLTTRLVIEHVPEEIRKLRIRRMNEVNRKKGRTTSQRSKILVGVNLYLTNAPSELLPGPDCRLLYRIRWHIELIFKLWKSNFALEQVAGIRKERVLCTVYAKLLCIFVTTKLVFWVRNAVWNTRKRELSEFRASKVLQTFLPDVRRLLLTVPSQAISVLREAMEAMMKHCLKSKQATRRYPLEMLHEVFV
ncbi:MAG: IS4 family transposase [bacterium]|nr:IS4 family transposase [bacterium]